MRRRLRKAIAAVEAGEDPFMPGETPLRTYSQDTVVRAARAANEAAERELLLKIGREVADGKYR